MKGKFKWKEKMPSAINAIRERQSQKPELIYEYIEKLCNAEEEWKFIDLFGRRYNARSKWLTIGFEAAFTDQDQEVQQVEEVHVEDTYDVCADNGIT